MLFDISIYCSLYSEKLEVSISGILCSMAQADG